MDLFAMAKENSASLRSRFESARDGMESDRKDLFEAFAKQVLEEGCVSINMRPWVLSDLMRTGQHKNIYQQAEELATVSGKPIVEILRERLGKYYDRRLAFDGKFDHGKEFRYGALNIGGCGPTGYGSFCVILNIDFDSTDKPIAYLLEDSLNSYLDANCKLDETSLREDIAGHCERHSLAALKHRTSFADTKREEWPTLICGNGDYVEAVFLEDVQSSSIDEVRVEETEYQRLFDLAFPDPSRTLGEGEKALAHDFIQILSSAKQKDMNIERI